jgi:hypothetical protein
MGFGATFICNLQPASNPVFLRRALSQSSARWHIGPLAHRPSYRCKIALIGDECESVIL